MKVLDDKGLYQIIKQDNDENDEIKLWDLQEDIGYVDEIDLKIIELIQDERYD